MYSESLRTIKGRLYVPFDPSDRENFPWFKAMLEDDRTGDYPWKPSEFPSDNQDFRERYGAAHSTYEQIQAIDDIDEILKHLNALLVFLEIAASKPLSIFKPYMDSDGKPRAYWVSRSKRIDDYFEERVLSRVRKSIVDLKDVQESMPSSISPTIEQRGAAPNQGKVVEGHKGDSDLGQRKNNFNNMPLEQVEKWFMQLATKKNTDNKPFLTEEQVHDFLDRAFCKNVIRDMLTLTMGDTDLQTVGALFYRYYTRCIELGFAQNKGEQRKYTELLTDNFTNYSHLKDSLQPNFSKYDRRKNAWSDTI